jgi:hypothetical protein
MLDAIDDGVARILTLVFSAATATPPVYCASMGQIGWQLLAPQQAGRPSQGQLLRAAVFDTTGYPPGASRSRKRRMAQTSATGSIGKGFMRGEPVSGAPDTPVLTSAS